MAQESKNGGGEPLEEVAAARRAAMLKFAISQQERKHYAEALHIYRQIITEYPDTKEETEARQWLLCLARLFGEEGQSHRMLALYGTLEGLYAQGRRTDTVAQARRARVMEILDEVRERDMREAEARAKLESTREGHDR